MLNISIVLYHPLWEQEVIPLVTELLRVKCLRKIYLLDNSGEKGTPPSLPSREDTKGKLRYMAMPSNLGYGRAHNIALRESAYYRTELHLVMNSDIQVKAEDIDAMHDWMISHPEVGQLMPRVVNPDGTQQYLAKRLPSPLGVFGRRFLPAWLMARRKGLFDERYFMYPEDIDLTRTIHRNWLTLYYPQWTITHAHARSSYNNKHMLWIHIRNMCLYFNKWGWLFDRERRRFNRSL